MTLKGGTIILFLLVFASAALPQNPGLMDSLIMGGAEQSLVSGIRDMNRRKAAIAYNMANASTPGFKPIRFQDEIEAATRLYGDASMLDTIIIDDEMVRTARVRLKHSAYVRLLSTKMGITRRIASLGKGG
ncbi:hypothetical protein HOH87_03095 [bacterium]|jgi:flagellar basal body rod protein FlgB|nr:hypothetical protein [bacterium]